MRLLPILTLIVVQTYGQSRDNLAETISTWTYDSLINQGTDLSIRAIFDKSPEQRTRKFEIATCLFEEAIRRDEKNATGYACRGFVNKSLGFTEKALVDYAKASKLEPGNFKHFQGKADCKMALEDFYGAIEDYLLAINKTNEREYSDYHDLLNSVAMCYYVLNKLDLALIYVNRAVLLDKENGKYYYVRGLIRIEQKKVKESCLDFSKAGELGYEKAYESIKEHCR
jgi:tetratricopeptide (TPR) repeat protein